MNDTKDNFLNLLSRKLDDAQTKALKVKGNAVIAAGAGSGKTQVLATRFAWLILTGQAKVDEILTLTFTNKAASEMYQRIYQTLSFFANHEQCEDLTENNIKLAKEALDSFSNAHIQTLDSYCGGIVRQCANRYGIKPDFTTGSADSARDIKNKAFQFVLENKDNIGIQTFSDAGKLQDFAESTFASTIEKYTSLGTENNYFINKLSLQRKEIVDAWNYYVLGYIQDSKFAFTGEQRTLSSYIDELRDAYMASPKKDDSSKANYVKLIQDLISLGTDIFNLEKITEDDVSNETDKLKAQLELLDKFINDVYITSNGKNKIADINKVVSQIKKVGCDFVSSIGNYLREYKSIYALNQLLDIFLCKINSSKRTSGNLSFNDVTSMALKALLENEDIRNQEKTSFKKIMIDEFQDNNGKNRDLLYLLSLKKGEFEDNGNCIIYVDENHPLINQIVIRDENGTITEDKRDSSKLFFVGDEKQSIYKFRGADVSVFNELTKDGENDLISMTYNYRSTAEVIKSFNMFFKGGNGIFLLPIEKRDYEAYYENDALKNNIELPTLNNQNVPIHLNLLNTNLLKNEDADFIPEKEQMAYFMAKKIFEIGSKDKNWKSIAILDKARTDRNIITKYLSMFNIPYEIDQFNNIFEDGIINDFYNYFRICVYPSDINAYGAYLSSPFCGLTVNDVEIVLSHLIKYAKNEDISFTPFPDSKIDDEISKDLQEKEYKKYLNGKNYFFENRSLVLQQKITSTLSDLWHKKGYKYETLLSQQTELCAEHFDMIFELGRQADSQGKSIAWFVDQLEILKKSIGTDDADIDAAGVTYPLERKQAVNIMTIHKSKGLQFDNVFVYGCIGARSKAEKSNVFFDEEFGVTIKPENGGNNYFYSKGEQLFKEKEVAEFRRLIYVAVTRAIKDVNIIGLWNPDTESKSHLRLIENAAKQFYQNINTEKNYNPEAGFDFINIKPIEYGDLPSVNKKLPIDYLRDNTIERTAEEYNKAEIINYECHPIERKTPSSLEPEFTLENQADIDSGAKYEESDDLLITANFTAADFGTLVHAYLEAQANNISPELFEPVPGLFKNLGESKIEEAKKQCIAMCRNFNKSLLGGALNDCKTRGDFYRAEWGFRMMYEGAIFTGSIDLIFSNGDGTYTIVDYKSDNSINPELYIGQQHCYRTAASKLLNIDENKITLRLYYTKKDEIVELD